jgi:hypothetical protein
MVSALLLALAVVADPGTGTAACVPADEICEVRDADGRAHVWPADVQAAEDDAFACIHFGGEPSGDPERQRFIETQMKKACNGVHRALPGLKRKYRHDALVTARLSNIEAYYGGPIP